MKRKLVRMTLEEIKRIPDESLRDIEQIPDEEIDFSDIPELDSGYWEDAPPGKIIVYIEPDVLSFFRSKGKNYKEEIRRALRQYVEKHR